MNSEQQPVRYQFPMFDWLRFSLAIVIVFSHMGYKIPHTGSLAVSCFLVLGGVVVTQSLMTLPKEKIYHFFLSRFVRIWIPYFISLSLLLLASLMHGDAISPKWVEFVIYKLSFVYNLYGFPQDIQYALETPLQRTGSHYWSLSAQEQFYIVLPLVLVLLNAKIFKSLGFWFVVAVISWIYTAYTSIVFGVLIAISLNKSNTFVNPIVCLGLFLAANYGLYVAELDPYKMIPFVSAAIVIYLMRFRGDRHFLGKLAGGMSFQLYLNAWIATFVVNFAIKKFDFEKGFLTIMTAVLLAIAISLVMYLLIDKNLIKHRAKFIDFLNTKAIITFMYSIIVLGVFYGLYHTDLKPFMGY